MIFFISVCLISSFAISFVATALMRTWAPRWGLMDQPASRKVHRKPTPLGGGLGIWLGVVLPIGLAQLSAWILLRNDQLLQLVPGEIAEHLEGVLHRSGRMWAILAGGTLLASMGLIDDLKDIRWQPRLALQFLVAVGLVAAGVQATLFADQAWIGMAVSALWILVLVNAFNFLDNMDGLSGGIALIAALLFATIMLAFTSEPRWLVAGVLLILSGSLGGFLCHNWSPARIFMGDSGSYFVGVLMASMTIVGTFYDYDLPNQSRHVLLAPLCILAIPLYDFSSVILIRLSQRRSPFHADKSHFSHRLVEVGLKPRNAVLTVHLATLTTGMGALLLYQVKGWAGAYLVVALIICVLSIIAILETAGRKNGNGT